MVTTKTASSAIPLPVSTNLPLAPAAISGEGVSPAAKAAARGSPPGKLRRLVRLTKAFDQEPLNAAIDYLLDFWIETFYQ